MKNLWRRTFHLNRKGTILPLNEDLEKISVYRYRQDYFKQLIGPIPSPKGIGLVVLLIGIFIGNKPADHAIQMNKESVLLLVIDTPENNLAILWVLINDIEKTLAVGKFPFGFYPFQSL